MTKCIESGESAPRRLAMVRAGFGKLKVDGLLITGLTNIRYLTGFTGSSAYLLLTRRGAWFFTDSRYTEQALEEVGGAKVIELKKGWIPAVGSLLKRIKAPRLGFEGRLVSYSAWSLLKKALPAGVRLVPVEGVVERVRYVKDPSEIDIIRAAARIADRGFQAARRAIKAGVSEIEVARKIEAALIRHGALGPSFDIIVASGARGALPHGKASDKLIKKGELVVVDMGALYQGYASDATRTYAVGRPGGKEREIYSIVKEAHERAIRAAGPGIKAKEVDLAARDHIRAEGYGENFGHGTGHGIGLDVHEGPVIGPGSSEILSEGMIFTIEPGIYLEGLCGVRIEEMVLVTADGVEPLTHSG